MNQNHEIDCRCDDNDGPDDEYHPEDDTPQAAAAELMLGEHVPDWSGVHIFCTCDTCMHAPIDPALLAQVGRALDRHAIPTPLTEPAMPVSIADVPWSDDDASPPLVRAPKHSGYAYCSEAEYKRLTGGELRQTPPAADLCGTYRHRAVTSDGASWCTGHMGVFSIIPPRNEHECAYGIIMVFADGKESTITASAVAACIRRGVYERLISATDARP